MHVALQLFGRSTFESIPQPEAYHTSQSLHPFEDSQGSPRGARRSAHSSGALDALSRPKSLIRAFYPKIFRRAFGSWKESKRLKISRGPKRRSRANLAPPGPPKRRSRANLASLGRPKRRSRANLAPSGRSNVNTDPKPTWHHPAVRSAAPEPTNRSVQLK